MSAELEATIIFCIGLAFLAALLVMFLPERGRR